MNTPLAPRYAIYCVPRADTALYRFGASVLGYDCYRGEAAALMDGVEPALWAGFVREPSVYGFHGTLKAPLYLAEGRAEDELTAAVSEFAASRPTVAVGELVIRELGSFIALVPNEPCPPLNRLAADCVQTFDSFRAPMSEQERMRRVKPGLSARQIGNIDRWGYPYVFDDFRFHMTLTGSLQEPERKRALQSLCHKLERISHPLSLTIDQIVIARQADSSSPFKVMTVAPLGGSL